MEHVNAEIIRTTIRAAAEILYAIADGKKVQYRYTTTAEYGTWKDFDAKSVEACSNVLTGYPNVEWRVAPKTIKIGDFEVPEPCKAELVYGQDYYIPSLTAGACWRTWNGDKHDVRALKSNLVHLDFQSAEIHAKALIEVSKGWWK